MKKNEHIYISQPLLFEKVPWFTKRFRTVAWRAFRDGKLVAKGKTFSMAQAQDVAKLALELL